MEPMMSLHRIWTSAASKWMRRMKNICGHCAAMLSRGLIVGKEAWER